MKVISSQRPCCKWFGCRQDSSKGICLELSTSTYWQQKTSLVPSYNWRTLGPSFLVVQNYTVEDWVDHHDWPELSKRGGAGDDNDSIKKGCRVEEVRGGPNQVSSLWILQRLKCLCLCRLLCWKRSLQYWFYRNLRYAVSSTTLCYFCQSSTAQGLAYLNTDTFAWRSWVRSPAMTQWSIEWPWALWVSRKTLNPTPHPNHSERCYSMLVTGRMT